MEFHIGEKVYLKVSPTQGVMHFGMTRKLSPRFVGLFEVLERIGEVAYRLTLPPSLSRIHDVFHVSLLRRYLSDPSHVLEVEPFVIKEDLRYEEIPLRIVDRKEQQLRTRSVAYVKIQWSNHTEQEATWELENKIR
ncbi:UNVERIFIED_CONTAM: hypothetical protein Sradi_7263100 [Sesamum radiatum]|uniref:Tf2-1-like SH3-like domain-containing protein n=1 Tax=Sesamum radiatum TaxID=300843 RepID=A0AAW2ILG3_SESRA